MSPVGEPKLNLEHTDQDENLGNVSLLEAHARVRFQANVRYGKRSEGRKLERGGGEATGTAENQFGAISSLTAQKYISKNTVQLLIQQCMQCSKFVHHLMYC
jgi:hypothetical protein